MLSCLDGTMRLVASVLIATLLPAIAFAQCDGFNILSGAERRCFRPGSGKVEWFKDCQSCPEMVVVPAGSFMMGSPESEEGQLPFEQPQHQVTLKAPFAVGRFAVTFSEWDACVDAGGCNSYRPPDRGWGRGRMPVIYVSWDDAKAYVSWLSRQTGKAYRLLSEAEREYVTRAGTTAPFWWGSSISTDQANYNGEWTTYGGSPVGEFRMKPLPVDSFEPNPWGLYQVHGNVADWVEDCWNESYKGAPADGSAWTTGDCTGTVGGRVLRGGRWVSYPENVRSAARAFNGPAYRNFNVGFRVARSLP
jgi:formylglycine-generating enzyme required for sulfatase activity